MVFYILILILLSSHSGLFTTTGELEIDFYVHEHWVYWLGKRQGDKESFDPSFPRRRERAPTTLEEMRSIF